jgi:hypothetical protein
MRYRFRGGLLALAGVAVVAAIAGFGAGSGDDGSAEAVRANVVTVTAPSAVQQAFGVVRGEPSETSADVPAGYDDSLKAKGLDPADTRAVSLPDGTRAYITPGAELTCATALTPVSNAFIGGCGPNTTVATEGMFLTLHPAPSELKERQLGADTVFIVGLVPDGASAVSFTDAGGHVSEVSPQGNLLSEVLSSAPVEIKFRDGAGQQQTIERGGLQ